MTMVVSRSANAEYENPPEGTHLAICYLLADLGIQRTTFKDESKLQHKIFCGWELCDEQMADGRPFVVSKEYTMSLDDRATLYKDLVSWRGRQFTDAELDGFDIETILGKPCLLSVSLHTSATGGVWPRVTTVSKITKGMKAPEPVNPVRIYEIGDPAEGLPQWIANKVAKREYDNWDEANAARDEERTGVPTSAQEVVDLDDDIPF